MSMFRHKKTLTDVLGQGMNLDLLEHQRTTVLQECEGFTDPSGHHWDCAHGTKSDGPLGHQHFVVHAKDSMTSTHLCPNMRGARVGTYQLFDGGGMGNRCPFCQQAV